MVEELIRILIVDDSAEDRALIRRALAAFDRPHELFEAATGEEGLRLVDSLRPACVLIDHILPDMDALAFLDRACPAERCPGPIIVITGQGSESIAVAAMKRGAADYLVKGTRGPDILRAVTESIETFSRRAIPHRRILIVDDNPADREAYRRFLAVDDGRYEYRDAETAEEALAVIASWRPDCILLDYSLPDMDGVETLLELRKLRNGAHAAVVMLTGQGNEIVAVRALKGGAQDYLVKATASATLPLTVSSAIDRMTLLERLALQQRKLSDAALALRQSQERLELAQKAGRVGTFEIELASGGVTWSDVHEELYGLRPGSFPGTLEAWLELVADEDRELVRNAIEHASRGDGPLGVEFRINHPTDGHRWMSVEGALFGVDQERPSRMLGVTLDVTERKRADEERLALLESERAARTEAERVSRIKDEFLATLSHELRTPLNAILGWAQLLERGIVDGDSAKEGIAVIARNARVQTQLIDDLLDMSRVISGKLNLDVRDVFLPEVIEAAKSAVEHAAAAKRITIETHLDLRAATTMGDQARLQQVIWNLLSNAIKFTSEGGRVDVRLLQRGNQIEVSVSDTGQGIKPEFLPFVFDKFRQADSSTTRRHGGLGLGLALVKQLTELHGGSVRVTSDGEGKGATFVVSLPVVSPFDSVESDADRGNVRQPGDESSLKGLRVLIVDDEEDARGVARRILESCGAVVLEASSAAEALDVVRDDPPDVMVSDIGMPQVDGYELIRQVRMLGNGRGANLPAAALTAFARSEDRRRALQAGYQSHVSKPVDPGELIAVVANLAGRFSHPGLHVEPAPGVEQ